MIDEIYKRLVKEIIEKGQRREDRTGTGTISIFGYSFRVSMNDGFPILTTKKIIWKSVVTELLWFLRGDTDIRYLLKNHCNIWNGDCYANYLKNGGTLSKEQFFDKIQQDDDFGKRWANLGPIYGYQWKKQLKKVLKEASSNPYSRRLVVNSWIYKDLKYMALPPCHYSFQLYVDNNYLDILVNLRSSDVGLGLPFNISSYSLLLHILSRFLKKNPRDLIVNIGDAHIYLNHVDALLKQIERESYKLPNLVISKEVDFSSIKKFNNTALPEHFILENYQHHPFIKMELSN